MANVTAMYRYLAELGANLNKMEDELFWHMTQLDSDEGIRSPFRESDEEYQRSFLRLRQSLQRSRSERARVRTLQEKERTAEDKCHEIVEKIWAFDERRLLRWLQEEEEAERHNLKMTLEEGETFRRELNEKLDDLQATRAKLREKLGLLEGCAPPPIASSRTATRCDARSTAGRGRARTVA